LNAILSDRCDPDEVGGDSLSSLLETVFIVLFLFHPILQLARKRLKTAAMIIDKNTLFFIPFHIPHLRPELNVQT
jgi:hypothetical protein